ncbi:alternate-type signal peptide domain-containing protein [Humidisolicoccus flavus]|uniref:alternate-type signal peptide domain-containing protein n=1 Tax=Humidisolicoccus flavus TaxID=3111414 RepID=UPI003243E8D1
MSDSTLHTPTDSAAHTSSQKKRMKGILALGVGTVLLIGGGSTYAYWSTEQALTAGTVESGDLNLELGTGTWTLEGVLDTTPTAVTDISSVQIVPGDQLVLTQALDVTLVGDTIEAILSVDLTDFFPAGATDYLTADFSIGSVGESAGTNAYRLDPTDVAAPITATVTINFSGTTPNRELVNSSFDLTDVAFTLEQASS